MSCSVRSAARGLWLALAFLLPASAAADPARSNVENVLRTFAAEYADGNLKALGSLWSHHADSSNFLRRHAALTRVRCLQLLGFTIDEMSVHEARATATLTLFLWITEKSGGFHEPMLRHFAVTLSTRDGAWRIIACEPAEAALAGALEIAPTAAERVCLLNLYTKLITRDLDRLIYQDALAQTNLGDDQEAKRLSDIAMDIATMIGDRGGQSLAIGINGIVKRDAGETREGVALAREAAAIAEEAGDPDVIARALINLGRAIAQDDHLSTEPAALYQKVLDLDPRLADRTLLVRTLQNLGVDAVKRLTDLRSARVYHQKALKLAQQIGDITGEAGAENSLAVTFESEHDCGVALPHLQRAARLESRGSIAAAVWGQLAECYAFSGKLRTAEMLMKRAIAEASRAHDRESLGGLLNVSARIHQRQGRSDIALDEARRASASLRALGWTSGGTYPRLLIALHRYSEAIGAIREELPLARALERDVYVSDQTLLGVAERALGRPDEALAALSEAITASEALRPLLGGDELQQVQSFEDLIACYREAVDLLIERQQNGEALRLAELQKGRALLNVLKHGRPPLSAEMNGDDRAKEASIRENLTALNREIAASDVSDVGPLRARLRDAQAEYDAFCADVYARNPRLQIGDGAIDVASADTMAARLPSRTAFIEYVSTGDWVDALVVRSEPGSAIKVSAHRSRLSQAELRDVVNRFSSQLARRDLAYRETARRLYALLLAPLARDLDDVDSLCIMPDDALWRIPFEALIDAGGRYLIEHYAIFYAPSISTYLAMTSRPTPKVQQQLAPLLALGNPASADTTRRELESFYRGVTLGRLPDAEREVKTLGSLYGPSSRIYTGAQASETVVKASAPRYRILHFATHAILDNHSPMFSRIVLADEKSGDDDGLLEAWEVMNLRLNADLVVLSACQTAGGRIGSGEGIVGMTWAFFAAGARSIVASQWNVSSQSTSQLMIAFHRALLTPGPSPPTVAAALRTAKLGMIHRAAYAHPFYWAPFVLLGADH